MLAALQYVEAVAPSRHPVSGHRGDGTGKELVGRAIHALSGCRGELVAVKWRGWTTPCSRHPLRTPEGGVHRRRPGAGGADRPGRRRDALPGRDRGPERDVAGEAAPPHRGAEILPAGIRRPEGERRADRLRHPSGPSRRSFRRAVSGGTCITGFRAQGPSPPPSGAEGGHPPANGRLPRGRRGGGREEKAHPPGELYTCLSTYDFPGNVRNSA